MALTQQFLEVPARHLRQSCCFRYRQNPSLVKRQRELLPQRRFNFIGRQAQRRDYVIGYCQRHLRHTRQYSMGPHFLKRGNVSQHFSLPAHDATSTGPHAFVARNGLIQFCIMGRFGRGNIFLVLLGVAANLRGTVEPIVSNTSPLIALSILNWLDLPRHFFDPVILPEGVVSEATRRGFARRGAREIANGIETGWIHVASPAAHELVASLSDDLGIGEAEAIVLAVERKAVLLIDDPSGRRRAKQLDVQIIGTLGLLALAKHAGRIPEVSSWVLKLQQGGYHLGERLIEKFLTDMGERPPSKEQVQP